jgi:hypothetical protein
MSDAFPTRLDAAHAALSRDEADDAARLAFYGELADGEMFVLLDREAEGATLQPRVFALEDGPVILVFDREERLAEFAGGVVPYAALPGRVLAEMLRGQGVGLGVNLGVAPSSMLLPPEALDWLAATVQVEPEGVEERPDEILPPVALPAFLDALDSRLARSAGLALTAHLASARMTDGTRRHLLAFTGAAPAAEAALARAAREALVFSGDETHALDILFLTGREAVAGVIARQGLRFDLPPAGAPARAERPGPGTIPGRPPRLMPPGGARKSR